MKTVKVKMTGPAGSGVILGSRVCANVGEVHEVPENEAKHLIYRGRAEAVDELPPAKGTVDPDETLSKRGK